MRIDFSEVRNVLASVDRLLVEHHGEEVHRPSGQGQAALSRRQDSKVALLADDLQAMQDFLQLARAEIAAVYWEANGREDPRRAHNHRWPLSQSSARDTNSRCGTSPRSIDVRVQGRPLTPAVSVSGRH